MSAPHRIAPIALLLAFHPNLAAAHAVLENTSAAQNAYYKGVIAIDHGCKGAPTTAIHVTIPDGFVAAKPMPKPGWDLTVETAAYAKPYSFKAGTLTQGAKTLTWRGNLPDADFDEFAFQGYVTDAVPANGTLYFPVVQECGDQVYRWEEIPTDTVAAAALKRPAPGVAITGTAHVSTTVAVIGDLRVTQAWAKAVPNGAKTMEGYMSIENRGRTAERLLGITSDIAATGTISDSRLDAEDAPAAPLTKGVEIGPGERLDLRPHAYHFNFTDLKRTPAPGESIKAVVNFEKAGPLPVELRVESSEALSSGASMPTEEDPGRM